MPSQLTPGRNRIAAGMLFAALGSQSAFPLEVPLSLSKKLLGDADYKDLASTPANTETPDNSIDPDKYIVGGGDGFQISIIGLPSQEFFPIINQDGNIYAGDFGVIKLGEITLTEAKNTIRTHVQKAMRGKYDVYVTLNRVKKAVVMVSGQLQTPGTFQVNGTMRILDVLKLANRGALPPLEEFNFREVERRRGDSVRTFDLLSSMANMDLSQNPYVYPGDNIMLHRIDRVVSVTGELNGPFEGALPLRNGETLADLLKLLTLKASADSDYILIQKADAEGRAAPPRRISLAEAASVRLDDRDMVVIGAKQNYTRFGTVAVSGEVVRPGSYPILERGTTAGEALRMAGGPRPTGSLGRAYVIKARIFPGLRKDGPKEDPRQAAELKAGPQRDAAIAAMRKIRLEDNTALTDFMSTGDGMIIDIGEDGERIHLEDGDRICIPKKTEFVYVSGTVKRPGPYRHVPGKAFSYYVGQAGGYTVKSDSKNEFVMTMYQDMSKLKDNSRVDEGDVLIVPPNLEYKVFTTIWLPVLQIIPTLISLGLSIYIINEQANK
jgi:protein involved in polysaccharide export with SLBB domain